MAPYSSSTSCRIMNRTTEWVLRSRSAIEETGFDIHPLGFDKVFPEHVLQSTFPLFRMPLELFSYIMTFLSTSDLEAFSLVDDDCRRISSLYAFKDAEIQHTCVGDADDFFSPNSIPSNHGCVRRLTIIAWPRSCPILPEPFINHVSQTIQALSNLHIIHWDCDGAIFPLTFLPYLKTTAVKHLRIGGTVIKGNDVSSLNGKIYLPLETMCLDVRQGIPDITSPSAVFEDLVIPSSPTLQQLTWTGNPDLDNLSFNISLLTPISFPNLRSLCLDQVAFNSDELLGLLLGPNSRVDTLSMDSTTDSTRRFFQSRGCMPYMTRFTWLHHERFEGSSVTDVLTFLDHNPQLQAVHVPEPLPAYIIDDALIPLIERKFALTSLHLVWMSPIIPETSLRVIGRIQTLRHLWISVGSPDAFRSTWAICHLTMWHDCVSYLRNLETLAFSKDTYKTIAHPLAPSPDDYYLSKTLPLDDDAVLALLSPSEIAEFNKRTTAQARSSPTMSDYDIQMAALLQLRHLAWEKYHAETMLGIAQAYGDIMPKLRWCFIGQMPMSINEYGVFCHPSDTPQREPCMSSLQKRMSMTLWRPV